MKNILVTGASSGIGFEVARQLLQRDDVGHVIALARSGPKLAKLAQDDPNHKLIIVEMDLTANNWQPLLSALDQIPHLDLLVNNAGHLVNKPFMELTMEDVITTYNVNVFSIIRLTQTCLPSLHRCPASAHVLNISSIGGVQGSVKFAGLSAYSSSKGALAILTECLAEELKGTNVAVNCLALGAVQTEMLTKAFPHYQASTDPLAMADLIVDIGLTKSKLLNGRVLSISSSTP